MKHLMKIIALSALIASPAFAGAEFHPSTYTTYKKHGPNNGSVRVLNRLPKDELSYTEIGMVRISTKQVGSYYDALEEIKDAAAQHGSNAIVLEGDAKLFSAGATTPSGSTPRNVSAIAVIQH